MPKISIIVPIYNSEKTLAKCLDSILSQTLEDIEILCMDDECKDNSRQIIDEYAKKDSRIVPVHLSGKGSYGRAVNSGFSMAKSDYAGIVESDDWCHPEMFETLYNLSVQNNADVSMASYFFVITDKEKNRYKYQNILNGINLDEENIFNIHTQPLIVRKSAYPWKNLYKKSFLIENDIKFREDNGGSYQDIVFNAELLSKAKRITGTEKALYYYNLDNPESSSNDGATLLLYPERRMQVRQVYIDYKMFENPEICEYFWIATYDGLKFFYKRCFAKSEFYSLMQNTLKFCVKDKIKFKYFNNRAKRDFKRIINCNYFSYKTFTGIENFLPKIFKIYNKRDKHKIIEIFNCIKLSVKYKPYQKLYKEAAQIRENQKVVLKKIRKEFGTRPIKVAFLIVENQKWNTSSLYKMFEKSPYFEPYVVVSVLYRIHKGLEKKRSGFQENLEFFKKLNLNIIIGYNEEKKEYIDLEQYHFDIIFYSSPWDVEFSKNQWIQKTSKNSILCYIPYAIAEASSSMIKNKLFFESVFKFFVADKKVINEYKKNIIKQNQNSITETGHTKLDVYFEPAKKSDIDKPMVIYAPHFTIGKRFFSTGTFDWSGKFLLEYAKSHQEYHWIFKPHPLLKSKFISSEFMTEEDIENYYNEWSKIGTLYEKGGYFDLFRNSECMITDCASFLLEYYPTQKPIIRLLSKTYTYNNALTEMIAKRYYVTRNLKQLKNNLNLILEKHQDPLKEYRMKYSDLFQPKRGAAAKKIYNILVNELSLSEEI